MKNSYIKTRNKFFRFCYTKFLRPIFFLVDPELIHDLFTHTGQFLGSNIFTRLLTSLSFNYKNKILHQKLAGLNFKNPVGLAAGFDKNAKMTDIISTVGFGHTEIGSVTGKPCAGNPKPRLWRHKKEKALRVYNGLANERPE